METNFCLEKEIFKTLLFYETKNLKNRNRNNFEQMYQLDETFRFDGF